MLQDLRLYIFLMGLKIKEMPEWDELGVSAFMTWPIFLSAAYCTPHFLIL